MKVNHVIARALALSFVVGVAACSGNKKEASDHAQQEQAKAEVPASPVEVKVFENVDPGVKSQLNRFLTGYFAMNQALIEDNQEGARAAALELMTTTNSFDMSNLLGDQMTFYHEQIAKINTGLKGIIKSDDIEEIRLDLVNVSEGMYALAKAYHPNESTLYYQFCPMAKNGEGANWLSDTKEIINPYMGQRMLKCGSTKEMLLKIQ